VQSYNNPFVPWRKLTLWHVLHYEAPRPVAAPKLRTLSVSSTNYTQSYCIMKSTWDSAAGTASVHHDALFRFGSWIYCGRVQVKKCHCCGHAGAVLFCSGAVGGVVSHLISRPSHAPDPPPRS